MRVFWKDVRRGQNLILSEQEGHEEIIGGYRENKRGIDAYAQTFGYEPGALRRDSHRYKTRWTLWRISGRGSFTAHMMLRSSMRRVRAQRHSPTVVQTGNASV